MKRGMKWAQAAALMFCCVLLFGMQAAAQGGDTIKKGIFAGDIDLSGMSAEEASQAVEAYVDSLKGTEITLLAADNTEVVVTAGELGVYWANPELITEAAGVGTKGNVIERYKLLKDLERENLILPIEITFDLQAISDFLLERCVPYDVKAEDATLIRENGEFRVVGGRTGYALDVEASVDRVSERLKRDWDGQPCTIALEVDVEEPRGKAEDLAQVKDVLGTFTTSYSSSGSNRSANVANGCSLINGTLLYPGDEFSTYESVAPFS